MTDKDKCPMCDKNIKHTHDYDMVYPEFNAEKHVIEGEIPLDTRDIDGEIIDPNGMQFPPQWEPPKVYTGAKIKLKINGQEIEGFADANFSYSVEAKPIAAMDLDFMGLGFGDDDDDEEQAEKEYDELKVEDIKKIKMEEGEILVIRIDPSEVSHEELDSIIKAFQGALPKGTKIIVAPKGVDLETLQPPKGKHPVYGD